jgi:Trk-type K+ transport system membrane component
MGLIVVGGLGFLVIPELIEYFRGRIRASGWRIRSRNYKFLRPRRPRLTVQTKMSLWVTFSLIAVGMLTFWLLESNHMLANAGIGEGLLTSAFQSITTRTAGFNTVSIGDLQPATLIVIMILMVIGGSPVSTSGGIKTLTFGILLLSLRTMILQKEKVEAFGRTLPQKALFTALSVFVLYIMTAAVGFFLLALFDPQIPLRELGFEMISALSTVGLSTGITSQLSTGSKVVLCVAMFIGRVGPISLVLSVFQSRKQTDYDFPDEDVIVGCKSIARSPDDRFPADYQCSRNERSQASTRRNCASHTFV